MYSFPNLESVHCSMSGSNCCILTCIPISQEVGKVIWHFYLFKNFLEFVVIHTAKCFSIVKEAERDVFSGIPLLFLWSKVCWHLISGSSVFSKSSLYTWKFLVHALLRPSLKDCREPARGVPPMAKVMRLRGPTRKGESGLKGALLNFLKHLPPKPESASHTALCFSLTLLTLTGGCPPTTFFWKKLI